MQRFFLYPVMILLIATKFRNKNHFQNMNKEQEISNNHLVCFRQRSSCDSTSSQIHLHTNESWFTIERVCL